MANDVAKFLVICVVCALAFGLCVRDQEVTHNMKIAIERSYGLSPSRCVLAPKQEDLVREVKSFYGPISNFPVRDGKLIPIWVLFFGDKKEKLWLMGTPANPEVCLCN